MKALARASVIGSFMIGALLKGTAAWAGAGAGRWEINVALTWEKRPRERVSELPLIDINYGIGERLQLSYAAAWLRVQETGSASRSGLSNSEVGLKWRFYDAGEGGLAISIYPKLEFSNPGRSAREAGLADRNDAVLLPLQFERTIGQVDVCFEVGREFTAHEDEWIFGIGFSREFGARFELAAELFGFTDPGLARSQLTFNTGLRVGLSKRTTLLVGLGRQLHNHFEESAQFLGYGALQFNW